MSGKNPTAVIAEVQQYYGCEIEKTSDLKTDVCVASAAMPYAIRQIVAEIHGDVVAKYYGCGLTIPGDFSLLSGMRAVDLGCGAGRDVYILSKLVGPTGRVHGVDAGTNATARTGPRGDAASPDRGSGTASRESKPFERRVSVLGWQDPSQHRRDPPA